MAPELLLVEDDARLRDVLALALEDHGYAVRQAADGAEAIRQVEQRAPAAVLLDLMLPDLDGIEVCRRLRTRSDVPVIMVTARGASTDIVAGLEAGADDYVTKPVVADELAARVRAVLRRVHPHSSVTRIGDLEVSVEEASVRKAGEPISLTKTEFRLLCELAAQPGAVKTREELLKTVWGYDYFGDTRLLDVHVRRLRTKVEDDPSDPRLILTVRGIGYRLAAEPAH